MDESFFQKLAEWLTQIAGAGIAILPLFLLIGLVKTVSQVDNLIGKFTGGVSKSAGNFGEKLGSNINNRRTKNAADRRGVWGRTPLGAMRRRGFRRDEKTERLAAEAKYAQHHYVNKYAQESEKYRKELAGGLPMLEKATGGKLGVADPAAMQRAFANAKFSIEKAELEEVKAHHATIDNLDESGLKKVLATSSSNTEKAAALERLVAVGSLKGAGGIEEMVNQYGHSGEANIMTKSLAGALAKDGPGFLRAPDIDAIARGQLGQPFKRPDGSMDTIPDNLEKMALQNLEANALGPQKMVTAGNDDLKYALDVAQRAQSSGNNAAMDKIKAAATTVLDNETLKGQIKHNEAMIKTIAGRP